MKTFGLGWLPDHPHPRDKVYGIINRVLPSQIDLRDEGIYPEIWNQGSHNSCVWHAIPAAIEVCRAKSKQPIYMPSRMFGYYNTRRVEGTELSDPGCQIRNAIKSLGTEGSIPESAWPYEDDYLLRRPPQMAYDVASKYQALEYSRVEQTENGLKACLVDGFPIIFGFMVADGFIESKGYPQTPICNFIGGHAVVVVGYSGTHFIVRNSWGNWGLEGHFLMPYDYILDPGLADDFWTVRLME